MKSENEFICVNRIPSLDLPPVLQIFNAEEMNVSKIENVSYPIYQTGVYSVVFSPMSTDEEFVHDYKDLEFYYKNNLLGAYVILISYSFFVFITFITLFSMCCVSCRRAALVREFRREMMKEMNLEGMEKFDKDHLIHSLIQHIRYLQKRSKQQTKDMSLLKGTCQ